MNMKIILDDEVVGELAQDGKIITTDPALLSIANTVRRKKFYRVDHKRTKNGINGYLIVVGKNDPGYAIEVYYYLFDRGYIVRE